MVMPDLDSASWQNAFSQESTTCFPQLPRPSSFGLRAGRYGWSSQAVWLPRPQLYDAIYPTVVLDIPVSGIYQHQSAETRALRKLEAYANNELPVESTPRLYGLMRPSVVKRVASERHKSKYLKSHVRDVAAGFVACSTCEDRIDAARRDYWLTAQARYARNFEDFGPDDLASAVAYKLTDYDPRVVGDAPYGSRFSSSDDADDVTQSSTLSSSTNDSFRSTRDLHDEAESECSTPASSIWGIDDSETVSKSPALPAGGLES